MDFEELKDPALQEKLKACNTADELVTLAEEHGIELSDEEVEGLSGGRDWDDPCFDEKCTNYTPL